MEVVFFLLYFLLLSYVLEIIRLVNGACNSLHLNTNENSPNSFNVTCTCVNLCELKLRVKWFQQLWDILTIL